MCPEVEDQSLCGEISEWPDLLSHFFSWGGGGVHVWFSFGVGVSWPVIECFVPSLPLSPSSLPLGPPPLSHWPPPMLKSNQIPCRPSHGMQFFFKKRAMVKGTIAMPRGNDDNPGKSPTHNVRHSTTQEALLTAAAVIHGVQCSNPIATFWTTASHAENKDCKSRALSTLSCVAHPTEFQK